MTTVGELREWLSNYKDEAEVGIDDGGLTLRIVIVGKDRLIAGDDYYEVGGIVCLNDLLGKTLKSITTKGLGDDEIIFETVGGEKYKLWHSQD